MVVSGSISGLIGSSGLKPDGTGDIVCGVDSDELGLAWPNGGSAAGGSESCACSGGGVEPGVGVFSGVIRAGLSGLSTLELAPDWSVLDFESCSVARFVAKGCEIWVFETGRDWSTVTPSSAENESISVASIAW